MRILVTRALQDAALTAAKLQALGHEPVLAPVLEIVPCEFVWPAKPQAMIATSAHAFIVPPPQDWHDLPLYVVGDATARAGAQAGFTQLVSARGDVGNLAELLSVNESISTLYLAGKHRKPDLEIAFPGIAILETYEARACDHLPLDALDQLKSNRINVVLHYSRRSAEIFLKLLHRHSIDVSKLDVTHICLSADVAMPLQMLASGRNSTLRVKIAGFPIEANLMDLI